MNEVVVLDKLQDPLKFIEAFAEHAPVGMQVYDRNGHSLYVNPQHTRIFGAPPPPGYCCLTDENVERNGNLHLVQRAFSGQPTMMPLFWYDPQGISVDPEYSRKYGKKCAIETAMIPLLDSKGEVQYVLFVFRDVTAELLLNEDRDKALRERDDAKALVQSVIDQTPAVIYIKDLQRRTIFANAQFSKIFNLPMEQILGKLDKDLFGKARADEYQRNDEEVYRLNSALELEEVARHADGTDHIYLSLKFPVRNVDGKVYGLCGISTDITERRKMEKELNRAKRIQAMGLLAGGVAHDFNNILTTIILTADTQLIKGAVKNPDVQEALRAIKAAAIGASQLTRQLLTFGARRASHPKTIDLGEVLGAMKPILDKALGEDIELRFHFEENLFPVHIDPAQIEQVVNNLCFNAQDAMPQGGTLTIELHNKRLHGQEGVELTVTDTGLGISKENLEHIFEPFFSTKKDGQHTGLGLSTVYGIVREAKGDIQVSSRPGEGARFVLWLPRTHEAPRPSTSNFGRRPVRKTGRETILLVEDQTSLRRATAAVLRGCGYTVHEAASAQAGLQKWRKLNTKIELIVSDIIMPKMNGLEMVEKISRLKASRDLKILFLSAYSEKKLSDYNFDQSRFHLLEKPYSADQLTEKIREIFNAGSD